MEEVNKSEDANSDLNTSGDVEALENKYSLYGYLTKHNDKSFKGIMSSGTTTKKRWFIYSAATCKLYYYKSEYDKEPLGEIDIALSSLSYEIGINLPTFNISSGGKEHVLEAPTFQKRLYWLQSLQNARREYNERLNLMNFRSGRTCVGRPESGLLRETDPLPEPAPDPHEELNTIMNKSMDSALKTLAEEAAPRARTNLNLPLRLFKAASASARGDGPLPPKSSESEPSTPSTPRAPKSPVISPTNSTNNFDKLSNKLRSSFRLRKPRFGKFSLDLPEEECKKCSQLQDDLQASGDEVSRLADRCDAYKEAVILLQKDMESIEKEKATLAKLINNSVTDDDILGIFREKDRKIVELEHVQHQMKNSLAAMTSNLRESRIHIEHLQEKLDILTSLVESKDNAIVELSKDLEKSRMSAQSQGKNSSTSTFYSTSPIHSYPRVGTISMGTQTSNSEYEDLIDKLEGYKCQNTFLNKEILELNLIFKRRNEREQKLISESSNWEAKFYQIQSKYLLLLNDLHSPQSNQHDSKVLSQLLQDVVDAQGSTDLRVVERQGKGYNEYGFCVSAPQTDILSKAEFLQKQSKANACLAQQQKKSSISVNWESQWESFIAVNTKELPQHPELKYLIREGIPYQYKGKVWRMLIESHIGKYKASLSPIYYQELLALRSSHSKLDPSAKQIELDLLRTLPNNRHYESPYSDGIPKLRRVLLAYSRHNLAVGYCQGLNRLGAIALLFLNEEDAFWCLVYIIEYLMPSDFYTRNLFGSQVDQRVLKDLIIEKLPRLYAHFEEHELDISLFTFNWFLCVYVDSIPPSTYLYIWDSFLYEGSKVLYRFAIAIFKLCEEDILNKNDYMSIFDYLRSVPEQVADLQKLKQIAFQWCNPLSMKYIRNRREHYRAIVKAELDEVEQIRKSYYHSKKETHNADDNNFEIGDEQEGVKENSVPADGASSAGEPNEIQEMEEILPIETEELDSIQLASDACACNGGDQDDDEQFELITLQ